MLFNDSYGIGLPFVDGDGNEAISVYDEDYPRVVRLCITSYKDYSIGTKHYYGELSVYGLPFRYTKAGPKGIFNHEVGDIADISGAYDKYKPEEMKRISIYLRRLLTDEELSEERFTGFVKGDESEAFRSRAAVIGAAKEEFKKSFCGRWVLRAEHGERIYARGE